MGSVGSAMRRDVDDGARRRARTAGVSATGAPLERRVAFPQGARSLLSVAPAAMVARLPRTAPLRALPRTAALAPGGYEASLAIVASPRASAGAATPLTPSVGGQATGHARRDLWYQAVLYVALNLGDVVSTYLGLRRGLSEGNPLMGALLAHDGFGALIAYKITITLAVLAGLWLLSAWSDRAARVALLVCNTLVALVVILNLAQFAALGR